MNHSTATPTTGAAVETLALDLSALPNEEPRHRVRSRRRGAIHVLVVRDEHGILGG